MPGVGRGTHGPVLCGPGQHSRLRRDGRSSGSHVRALPRQAARGAPSRLPGRGSGRGRRPTGPAVGRAARGRKGRGLRRLVRHGRRAPRRGPRAPARGAAAALRDARGALRRDAPRPVVDGRQPARGGAPRAAREARLRRRARGRAQPLGRELEPRGAGRRDRRDRSHRARRAEGDDLVSKGYEIAHVDELEELPINGGEFVWRPIRRRFEITAFGTNAYTARAGQRVVEEHSERDGHEEMYVVLRGRATFTLADDELDAPAGTVVFVRPGTKRGAIAAEDGTAVLAVGAKPGVVFEPSPWEDIFAANSYADSGDLERALDYFEQAVELDPEQARQFARDDSDFDAIRDDPRFADALHRSP